MFWEDMGLRDMGCGSRNCPASKSATFLLQRKIKKEAVFARPPRIQR